MAGFSSISLFGTSKRGSFSGHPSKSPLFTGKSSVSCKARGLMHFGQALSYNLFWWHLFKAPSLDANVGSAPNQHLFAPAVHDGST